MIRSAITVAAYAALALFVLIIAHSAYTMGQRISYRQACIISAAQLDEPVTACGAIR